MPAIPDLDAADGVPPSSGRYSVVADGSDVLPAAQPVDEEALIEAVPLLAPRGPVAGPIVDRAELQEWADLLAAPGGPVAIDAERASGFRYGSRAYLVQLRRPDLGTVLIDPIPLGSVDLLAGP